MIFEIVQLVIGFTYLGGIAAYRKTLWSNR